MPLFSAITADNGNAQTRNVSHTVSGSNRYMLVSVMGPTSFDVNSVTWMGTNLTLKAQHLTSENQTQVWQLIAPATGTGTVTVQFAAAVPSLIVIHTYTAVNQSTPTRTPVTDDVLSGTSHSFTVPSDTDELVVGIVDADPAFSSNMVSGAGQTTRVVSGSQNHDLVDDETGASPNVTLEYSWTGSGPVSFIALSLRPPETAVDPGVGFEGPRFQNVSFSAPAGSSTELRWQHNLVGTQNRMLLVGVMSTEAVVHPLQGVQYRGRPLVFAGQVGNAVGVYYLTRAPAGDGEVRVPLGSLRLAGGVAVSIAGVNPPNPIAQIVTNSGTGTGPGNPTVTVPSADDQLVVDLALGTIADLTFAPEQTGQVERLEQDFATSAGPGTGQSGNMLVSTRAGLASTVLSWDASGTTSWWTVGIALLPPQPGTVILGNRVVQDILPQWWGARGTGGGDDGPALERVMAVSALRGSQPVTIPAGVYNIETNLTLDASVRFAQGAILRPTSGVTISVDGPVDPSIYRSFDTSLGGAVAFTGPYSIASAQTISVQFLGAFVITGTAAIETILLAGEDAIVPGSRITFKFNAAASLLSTIGTGTGTGNIAIVGGDFTASADDILTLVFVDGAWRA